MLSPVVEKRYQPLLWRPVTFRAVREVKDLSFDTVAVPTEDRSDSTCTMIVVKACIPWFALDEFFAQRTVAPLNLQKGHRHLLYFTRLEAPHEVLPRSGG